MSVIVKGMEMPKSCSRCRWFDMGGGYGYQCTLLHKSFDMWNKIMIDADKFKADHSMKNDCAECEKELQGSSRSCEYDRIYSKMDFCEWIDNAETVIEAEE